MVCVKKNATICEFCAPLFNEKCRCFGHTFNVFCLWICAGSAGIRYCSAFYVTCQNSALFPTYASNAPHFHGASGFCATKSGLGKRRGTFRNCSALARKDAILAGKTAHLQEDGALWGLRRTRHNCAAAIKVRHSQFGKKWRTLRRVFKCRYGMFAAFFLTCTITSLPSVGINQQYLPCLLLMYSMGISTIVCSHLHYMVHGLVIGMLKPVQFFSSSTSF